MALKKCRYCKNQVPEGGQCNKCGFLDGFARKPTDGEYKIAREINKKHNYRQFVNVDMLLLDQEG
jgi:hypothetical protein